MAKRQVPTSSEILDVTVLDKGTTAVENIEAFDETEAAEKARGRINPSESSYRSLSGVSCVLEPRKGLLGIGKRVGEWEAKYSYGHQEVTVRYRPPARIQIHYGPSRLKCTQCGNVMNETTEGVHHLGRGPSPERKWHDA